MRPDIDYCPAFRRSYQFRVSCGRPIGHDGPHEGTSNWDRRISFSDAAVGVWTCIGQRVEPKVRA